MWARKAAVKSVVENDTAFYRGYSIDDRSLTSLRVALATIVAERFSSVICNMPASSSFGSRNGEMPKGTWRVRPYKLNARPSTSYVLGQLISIASDPLWALPYRAQIATGFATQLPVTSGEREREEKAKTLCFQDSRAGGGT
jgi:hypothetical protein